MNAHQEHALANHCRFGFETASPGYSYLDDGGKASIVLSVNSGHE
jgi:hypothetical protein